MQSRPKVDYASGARERAARDHRWPISFDICDLERSELPLSFFLCYSASASASFRTSLARRCASACTLLNWMLSRRCCSVRTGARWVAAAVVVVAASQRQVTLSVIEDTCLLKAQTTTKTVDKIAKDKVLSGRDNKHPLQLLGSARRKGVPGAKSVRRRTVRNCSVSLRRR